MRAVVSAVAISAGAAAAYLLYRRRRRDPGRVGDYYKLTAQQILDFHQLGLARLESVLTDEEVRGIEEVYDKFMRREIHVPGRDFCDMSKTYDTPFEQWSIVNAMLPTKYHPPLAGNAFERVAETIVAQLFPGKKMVKDYDQLLNKRPGKEDAVFAWHQDMAYWPPTKDTATVTLSLAIDDSTEQNGCLRFVPRSGLAKTLREHKPLGSSRDEAHAIQAVVGPEEEVRLAPVARGSLTVHDEWVVHGSGGNGSKGPRRTYVIAFRAAETVAQERAAGFTHSHNDKVNWDTFREHMST